MRRRGICVAAAFLALVFVPTASAGQPVREFIPAGDFTISGSCAFDVNVHILANKEYGITFGNGATLVTGALSAELTNASNPQKSIALNIPGPGVNTFSADGARVDARGPWLFFFPGALVYAVGHMTLTVTPTGDFSLEQLGGTSTDICAVLA